MVYYNGSKYATEEKQMRYNILGFNQEKLVEEYSNLNGSDIIVLRVMMDILERLPRKMMHDEKEYVQMTYDMLLGEIPFVTQSVSTIKKIVQKLIDSGLIERHLVKKGGNFTYFRVTDKLIDLQYSKEESESAKEADSPVCDTEKEIESDYELMKVIPYDNFRKMVAEYGTSAVVKARKYTFEKCKNGTKVKDPCAYMRKVLEKKYYQESM